MNDTTLNSKTNVIVFDVVMKCACAMEHFITEVVATATERRCMQRLTRAVSKLGFLAAFCTKHLQTIVTTIKRKKKKKNPL